MCFMKSDGIMRIGTCIQNQSTNEWQIKIQFQLANWLVNTFNRYVLIDSRTEDDTFCPPVQKIFEGSTTSNARFKWCIGVSSCFHAKTKLK